MDVVDIEDECNIPPSQPEPEHFLETARDSLGREDLVDISDDDSQPVTPTEIEGPKDSIEVTGEAPSGAATLPNDDPEFPELVGDDDEVAYTASLDAIMTAGFSHDEAVHALNLKNNELGPAIEYLLEELNKKEKYREELLNQVFYLDRVSESQVDYYQYTIPDLEAAIAGFKRNIDTMETIPVVELGFQGEIVDPENSPVIEAFEEVPEELPKGDEGENGHLQNSQEELPKGDEGENGDFENPQEELPNGDHAGLELKRLPCFELPKETQESCFSCISILDFLKQALLMAYYIFISSYLYFHPHTFPRSPLTHLIPVMVNTLIPV